MKTRALRLMIVLICIGVLQSCEKDIIVTPQSSTPKITQLPKVFYSDSLKVSLPYSVEPPVHQGYSMEWHYSDSSMIEHSAVPMGTQTHLYPYDGTFHYYALLRDSIKNAVVDSVYGTVIIASGLASAKILFFYPKDTIINSGNKVEFGIRVDSASEKRSILLWDFGDGIIETTAITQQTNSHSYIQKKDYTIHVSLYDTVSRQILDSVITHIHWQMVPLNLNELLNTRFLSVDYFIQVHDCSDSSRTFITTESMYQVDNSMLPITWSGDSVYGGTSSSLDYDYTDPNNPNNWSWGHGRYGSGATLVMEKDRQNITSFVFSTGYTNEEKSQHSWKQLSYDHRVSIQSIPYENTVGDTISFYLPIFMAKDRLVSVYQRDSHWETPYPYAIVNEACGVSWGGNPQAYVRLKFFK